MEDFELNINLVKKLDDFQLEQMAGGSILSTLIRCHGRCPGDNGGKDTIVVGGPPIKGPGGCDKAGTTKNTGKSAGKATCYFDDDGIYANDNQIRLLNKSRNCLLD